MRAAVVRSIDRVEVVEMPVPEIGPGEILVAMRAVGLCGSDITPWYVATKAPAVLGHETAGVVAKVGPGVVSLAEGDRVFVHHHAPCGVCPLCRKGETVMCAAWKPTRIHPGGLAELVRVEALTVSADTLRLPDALSFEDGAMVEPVACAVKAVAKGEVREGDTALVVGLGSNGLLLGVLARHAGAKRLVGVDPDPARRRLSLRFGFDEAVAPGGVDSASADVVFVIPTAAEAVQAALDAAAPAARVVFYSPIAPGKVWPLEPNGPYFRDLTLRFSYSCGPAETRRALALIEAGVVRAASFITHRLPLERAQEAFRLAAQGGDVLKVLIEIGPARG